jgi:hypothetical protein
MPKWRLAAQGLKDEVDSVDAVDFRWSRFAFSLVFIENRKRPVRSNQCLGRAVWQDRLPNAQVPGQFVK